MQTFDRTLFIRYSVPLFFAFSMVAIAAGYGFIGIIGAGVLSILTTSIGTGVGEGVGRCLSNKLYGTGYKDRSLADQLSGDLNQVRHLKRANEFAKALVKVGSVLEQAPGFPEALYLKAAILFEGYNNYREAKKCLREIILVTDPGDITRRWAGTMLEEINAMGKSA